MFVNQAKAIFKSKQSPVLGILGRVRIGTAAGRDNPAIAIATGTDPIDGGEPRWGNTREALFLFVKKRQTNEK